MKDLEKALIKDKKKLFYDGLKALSNSVSFSHWMKYLLIN